MPTIDERLEIAYNVMPIELRYFFGPIRDEILKCLNSGEGQKAKELVLAWHADAQKQFADIIESIANG